MGPAGRWAELQGVIASAGFASGDRIVVGHWPVSPIGPFSDVMWASADGVRHLLAPSDDALALITGVYRFERTELVVVDAHLHPRPHGVVLEVRAGPLAVTFEGGRALPVPFSGRRGVVRRVQGPVARVLLGVRTYGVTPTGVEEWYRATSVRRVVRARATRDGVDLGALRPVRPAVGFGVSEPPSMPTIVAVRPLLRYPAEGG